MPENENFTPETRTTFSNQTAWLRMPSLCYLSLTLEYSSRDTALNELVVQAIAEQSLTVISHVTPAEMEKKTQTLTTISTEFKSFEEYERLKNQWPSLCLRQGSNGQSTLKIVYHYNKDMINIFMSLFLLGSGASDALYFALHGVGKHSSDQVKGWLTHLIGEQAFQHALWPATLGLAGAGLLGLLYGVYRRRTLEVLEEEIKKVHREAPRHEEKPYSLFSLG